MKGRWWLVLVLAGILGGVGSGHAQPTSEPEDALVVDDDGSEEEGEPPLGDEDAMVLNFERADIREVIHSLASALGISYTIDPRVEGQVTIRTTGRIARADLFPLLNQILRNNGIAAVKVGDVYQVLPVAEAKTRAGVARRPETRRRLTADNGFAIEILSLRHVSSEEMANILQPFVTPGGDVLSYPRANVIVVTDLVSNVERLRELAATFDVDVFRNLRIRVFKVEHGDPEELANEVLAILAPYGVAGEDGGDLYMVPLTRLNSLVVFALDTSVFGEVARWLRLLDIPADEGAGRQTFVYSVENAKAVDLAEVLNELFGGDAGGGGGGLGGRRTGAAPAGIGLFGAGGVAGGRAAGGGVGRRGTAVGGASRAAGQQAGGAAAGAAGGQVAGALGRGRGRGRGGVGGSRGGTRATGAAGGGVTRGISLPGGGVGTGTADAEGPPPIFKEEVRIVADEVTNSLIVLATKRDYQLIHDVLRRIDIVPRQVLLEVTIAEVTLNKDLDFGVSYAAANGRLNMAIPGGEDASGSVFANRMASQLGGLIGTATRVPAQGAFAVISDREHFQVFLNALQGRTSVKMLSAPHIVAADNREAHILVGDSVPILTSTVSSTGITGTTGATVNSVQYRDTGKILTVLPQVNSKGLVNLQIRQEVSAVGAASFGSTNSPSFSTREAETTVVVQDGDSVLIGGIIDDQITHSRSGIPFLMDVPVLGVLFRNESEMMRRTELLVLITPYVMRNRDEARDVTESFSKRLEGLRLLRSRMRRTGIGDGIGVRRSVPERAGDVAPTEAAP